MSDLERLRKAIRDLRAVEASHLRTEALHETAAGRATPLHPQWTISVKLRLDRPFLWTISVRR